MTYHLYMCVGGGQAGDLEKEGGGGGNALYSVMKMECGEQEQMERKGATPGRLSVTERKKPKKDQ